jgi:hypothetical protein
MRGRRSDASAGGKRERERERWRRSVQTARAAVSDPAVASVACDRTSVPNEPHNDNAHVPEKRSRRSRPPALLTEPPLAWPPTPVCEGVGRARVAAVRRATVTRVVYDAKISQAGGNQDADSLENMLIRSSRPEVCSTDPPCAWPPAPLDDPLGAPSRRRRGAAPALPAVAVPAPPALSTDLDERCAAAQETNRLTGEHVDQSRPTVDGAALSLATCAAVRCTGSTANVVRGIAAVRGPTSASVV